MKLGSEREREHPNVYIEMPVHIYLAVVFMIGEMAGVIASSGRKYEAQPRADSALIKFEL